MLLDCGSLGRQAVHEVYADIVYSCLMARLHCIYSLTGVVATTQKTKQVIREGLDSHAYSVYTYGMEGTYIGWGYIIWVTLNREFCESAQAKCITEAICYLAYLFRGQTGGGSSSEVEGIDGGSFKVILAQLQFLADGADITCGFFLTHGREEAAVYTTFGTNRDMYVYARQTVRSLS